MKRNKQLRPKRVLCVALAAAMCFGCAPNMCMTNIFAADASNTSAQIDDSATGATTGTASAQNDAGNVTSGGVSDTLTNTSDESNASTQDTGSSAGTSSNSETGDANTNTNDNTTSNEEDGIMLMSEEDEDTSAAVTINDENLRKAICTQLGITYTQGTTITENQMASLTELKAENAGITDLTGLEKAVNLETLDLSGNDLSAALSAQKTFIKSYGLDKLKNLDLSNAKLSDTEDLMTKLAGVSTLETVDFSSNNLMGTFVMPGVTTSWAALKSFDLSNNDLNGINLAAVFEFSSEVKINLSKNRIWQSENAGDWFVNVVSVGIDKFDFSNQKSLIELRAVYIKGVSSAFDTTLVNLDTKTIDLGSTLNTSLSFKVQGYGALRTMSANLNNADTPVMIAGPETNAAASDNCLFTVNLEVGVNTFPLVLTHANGETDSYTVKVTRTEVPSSSSGESAGIKDTALQIAICNTLKQDAATHVVTQDEMSTIKSITADGVTDVSGLEYATNLTSLILTNTTASTIDVSKLTSLKTLQLSGSYSAVTGLENLTKLTTLTINQAITGYEKLSTITTLTINGTLSALPALDALTNLNTLTLDASDNMDLSGLSCFTKLKKLTVNNYSNGVTLPSTLNNLWKLNLVCANGTIEMPAIQSNRTSVTYTIEPANADAELNIDFGKLNNLSESITVKIISVDNYRMKSLKLSGSSDAVSSLIIQYADKVSFDSNFAASKMETLQIFHANDLVELPESGVDNVTNLWLQDVSFENGEIPEKIKNFKNVKELWIYKTNITDLKNMNLSQCSQLTTLNIYYNQNLTGSLDASQLPASLTSFNFTQNKISALTGDWSKLSALEKLQLDTNNFSEFPSEAVSKLTALKTLTVTGGSYSTIAEDTFANLSSLTTLKLGDYLPLVKVDGAWVADPDRNEGKAIAKLKEASQNVTVTYQIGMLPSNGRYSALLSIGSNLGTLVEDAFTETSFTVTVPTGSSSVTLIPKALLEDTVITVDGVQYKSGDEIAVELNELVTTVTLSCYNSYVNEKYLPLETTYTLTIVAGEYIQNFQPEEGKVYSATMSLKKADGSTSMADGYFSHDITIRYKDGQYEVRITTNKPSYITDMEYSQNGVRTSADIVGGDGVNTREYRLYLSSLDDLIMLIPRVAPMGNQYTSCYMYIDMTKILDITSTVGVDTADLNAAINKAIAITEKNNVYTNETYSAMTSALEEAQKIAELSAPTQTAVDDATKTLTAAIDALVVDESKLADKTALKSAIATANALTQGNHTDTAWNTLKTAISDAQAVYDTLEAKQSEVDAATKALNNAVTLFNTSDAASTLDKNNLADGVYSIYGEMFKVSRDEHSMANDTINHTIKLTVEDGKYYLTMDFQGLEYLNKFGYLAELSYYNDGYTYGQYGSPEGTTTAATVLTTQKNADGSDVYDEYNQTGGSYAGKLYPDQIKFPLVATALADEDGYVALHVFVPVMESISEGNGDQDVLLKLDWTTLKATTEDDDAFTPQENAEQSAAVDLTDSATGLKIHADKGVFESGIKMVVTPITTGTTYEKAATALADIGKKFKLYEIHFEDTNGNEVQPNGMVTVYYPIASGYDSNNLALYRINDDGSKTLIKGAVQDGYYVAVQKSFSTYALVEKGSTVTDAEANAANTTETTGTATGTTDTTNTTADTTGTTTGTTTDTTTDTTGTTDNTATGTDANNTANGTDTGNAATGATNTTTANGSKTGDANTAGLWLLLVVAAAGAAGATAVVRRRKRA